MQPPTLPGLDRGYFLLPRAWARQPGPPSLRQPLRVPQALPLRRSVAVMASLCCCCCLLSDLGGIPVGWARLGFWSPHFRRGWVVRGRRCWSELDSGATGTCPQWLCLSVPLSSGPLSTGGAASPSSPRWAPERIGRCTEPPEDVTERGGRPGRRQGSVSWVVGRGGFGSSSTRICEGAFWAKGTAGVRAPRPKRRRVDGTERVIHPLPKRRLDRH